MKIPESMKRSSLILKPDYGSRINCVLNSGLRISVSAGLLGAVSIVFAIKVKRYLDFGTSNRYVAPPSVWVVPGLENLGNNCFLNVVLQALASCSSFRKYLREMMEEYGSLPVEEGDQNVPLVNSLTALVEELCTIRHKMTVLSPRNLMLAMDHYIPNFNLARQQDAEEALSHLLSSLREEISEYCVPIKSFLADLPALPNGRFVSSEEESDWRKWNCCFLKPFDGILGSVLLCKSCSFQILLPPILNTSRFRLCRRKLRISEIQISLDYQLFHSLHLSPPTSNGGTIMAGCALEDCLRRFFVAEHVDNYNCSSCWHNAAIRYLSAFTEDKRDIETLERCNRSDSCECKMLPSLEAFPWSNRFSRTFKQLSVARSPKILCIHLQRASYNILGQSSKLTGHVRFPLILDLSPFMNTGIGIKTTDADSRFGPLNLSSQEIRPFPYSKYQTTPTDRRTLGSNGKEIEVATEEERNATRVENGPHVEPSERTSPSSKRSFGNNADVVVPLAPSRRQVYRLVSVVEHFGSSGSGHYTVYRKVTAKIGDKDPVGLLESAVDQWFCISDSEVYSVSEKDVLGANASMLFYEKIDNS